MEWSNKDSVPVPAPVWKLKMWNFLLSCVLNPWPTYGVVSHTGRTYASESPGKKWDLVPLILHLISQSQKFYIIPTNLGSACLGGLSSERNTIIVLLKWKQRLPSDYLGFLMLLNQKGNNPCCFISWGNWSWLLRRIWVVATRSKKE